MHIKAIPAFADNYIWLLSDQREAVVVDPGDAVPVERILAEQQLNLAAVLITHHHPDHTAGIGGLLNGRRIPVYGPAAEADAIPQLTRPLRDGDTVSVLGRNFDIISVPGHTLGHIAYYSAGTPGLLFCGDTLFSAGCGRLFEGTPEQMLASLTRLAALPDDTRVYCTHEYTQTNLAFATTVEPDNRDAASHVGQVQALRAAQRPSLPSTLELERRINPFLRTRNAAIVAAVQRHAGRICADEAAIFAALRNWKDRF